MPKFEDNIVNVTLSECEGSPASRKFDDVILISTSDDLGIENLHVMIHEDQGNLIESGEAMDGNDGFGVWCYFTEVPVPSGTSVIVQAAATDCLGNVGALRAGKTIS